MRIAETAEKLLVKHFPCKLAAVGRCKRFRSENENTQNSYHRSPLPPTGRQVVQCHSASFQCPFPSRQPNDKPAVKEDSIDRQDLVLHKVGIVALRETHISYLDNWIREPEFRSRSANNAVETADRVLDSILFPTAVAQKELKNLKEAKSSGADNIPAKFLKELANELSKPLAHIFRSSFELGRSPLEWKTANIFPIYKGGTRTNANNYRPVSLTCICCKIMEAIVKKATMEFLEQAHLISDLQHGFRQNGSCLSSLLLSTEQWTRALDEDGRVDVIYTDFIRRSTASHTNA
nr:unnamed protein product [Spirometra erinaceieuropaei]